MTKVHAGTVLISQVMNCKIHAIGKAIRTLFVELVTYLILFDWLNCYSITLMTPMS